MCVCVRVCVYTYHQSVYIVYQHLVDRIIPYCVLVVKEL